ncbi:hypothetical protein [Pseudoroseomonas sp. WGS1072]|uniref:hypothetical protein n=1 Tax=Roseomonas sp. WGS1072 TaxID=3366816 RepID=UPI003BF1D8AA
MRYAELRPFFTIPESHPYVSVTQIDPADHRRLTRMVDSRPELRVLGTLDRQPDRWTVYVGCASRRVQSEFDHWSDNLL